MTAKTAITTIITALLIGIAAAAPTADAEPRKPADKAKTTQTARKGTKGRNAKSSAKKRSKSKSASKGSSAAKKASSADVRRQQEAVQKEIRLTQEQIRENDAAVKKNLRELGKLEGDIAVGKKKVAEASGRVTALQKNIGALQQQIAADEKSLQKLRSEYLKAIKKMRTKRRDRSVLAFVLSSKNFNQALRRIRYLRQFSDWRDRKSSEIENRVVSLRKQTARLAQTKSQYDKALAVSLEAQRQLQTEYNRQDAIVVDLRKNGQALHAHLSKKQQEVNALKNRVSALIAEEQRKAEADRLARERAEAERQARLQAEADARAAAQAHAQAEAEALARRQAEAQREQAKAAKEKEKREEQLVADNKNRNNKSKAVETAEATSKPAVEKRKPKKETAKKETAKKDNRSEKKNGVSYAEARKRRPRSGAQKPSPSSSSSKASSPSPSKSVAAPAASDFAGMKGRLPRPVAGAFKVTSRFGRHALPDMHDVTFDNPGIDAEVAPGASAQAVYAGRVSGVYVVPGYSTVVIVNHGGYYTVYGNISAVAVKVGDNVRQGQALGSLETDEDDPSHSSIHFEVWKNRDKLDPLGWIR